MRQYATMLFKRHTYRAITRTAIVLFFLFGGLYAGDSIIFTGWWGRGTNGPSVTNIGWNAPGSGLYGSYTGDNGAMNEPRGIYLEQASGWIYVADRYNDRIQKFSAPGVYASKWGTVGKGDNNIDDPFQIGADTINNYIYVSDYNNNRVMQYDTNGVTIGWFGVGTNTGLTNLGYRTVPSGLVGGMASNGDGGLNQPRGIACDAYGDVYICDRGNNRVVKFSSNGTLYGWWGRGTTSGWHHAGSAEVPITGTGDWQFNAPIGIAINGSNVYVVDNANNRVVRFGTNTNTSFHGFFGRGPVIGWNPGGFNYTATAGNGYGELNGPHKIAIDKNGDVYVAENNNYRVQKFTANGDYIAVFGDYGKLDGQFLNVYGLAVTSNEVVYVADGQNHRIHAWLCDTAPRVKVSRGGFTTNAGPIAVSLSVNETNGYWSTNGALFYAFTGTTNLSFSASTSLYYYGQDGSNNSGTNLQQYYIGSVAASNTNTGVTYPTVWEAVSNAGPNQTVVVFEGIYNEYVYIFNKTNLSIISYAWLTNGNTNAVVMDGTGLLGDTNYVRSTNVHGVTNTIAAVNAAAFSLARSINISILGFSIRNYSNGIYFYDSNPFFQTNITFAYNRIYSNGIFGANNGAGIKFNGSWVNWAYIYSNEFFGNAGYGVDISFSDYGRVYHNKYEYNYRGILVDGSATFWQISSNRFYSNYSHGLFVDDDGADNNIVLSNYFAANDDGIRYADGDISQIISNVICSNRSDGIEMNGQADAWAIKFNQIFDNTNIGITLYGNGDNTGVISNNLLCNSTGISFTEADSNYIAFNTIISNYNVGISLSANSLGGSNAYSNFIVNNIISYNYNNNVSLSGDGVDNNYFISNFISRPLAPTASNPNNISFGSGPDGNWFISNIICSNAGRPSINCWSGYPGGSWASDISNSTNNIFMYNSIFSNSYAITLDHDNYRSFSLISNRIFFNTTAGVNNSQSDYLLIFGNDICSNFGTGIYMAPGTGLLTNVVSNTIAANNIFSNGNYDIRINSENADTNFISNNFIHDTRYGIYLENGPDAIDIFRNIISNCFVNGIYSAGNYDNNAGAGVRYNNFANNLTNARLFATAWAGTNIISNYWGAIAIDSITNKFADTNADTNFYAPYRLGWVGIDQADIDPPAEPTGVTKANNGVTNYIVWDAVPGAAGYRVWRANTVNEWTNFTVPYATVTSPSYMDTAAGAGYYYYVTAFDSAAPYSNESFFSAPETIANTPPVVTNLSVTPSAWITNTPYTFSAVYYDFEGDGPSNGVNLVLSNTGSGVATTNAMLHASGTFATGATYTNRITISTAADYAFFVYAAGSNSSVTPGISAMLNGPHVVSGNVASNTNTGLFYGTIQDAVNAAQSNETVAVFAGIYSERVYITNKTGVALVSWPWMTNADNTQVVLDGSGISATLSAGITISNSSAITVRGISARLYTNGIILWEAATNCVIEANNLYSNGYGMSNGFCGGVLIKSNSVHSNAFLSNFVWRNNGGIINSNSSRNLFFANLVASNTSLGIGSPTYQGSVRFSNTFINNTIISNGGYGITLAAYYYDTTIVSNFIASNNSRGIYCDGFRNSVIISNMLFNNNGGGAAIYQGGADNWTNTIAFNKFISNTSFGFGIFSVKISHSYIYSNIIDGNGTYGLWITNGSNAFIQNNVVSGSQYGIYINDATNNIITRNAVSNCSITGIYFGGLGMTNVNGWVGGYLAYNNIVNNLTNFRVSDSVNISNIARSNYWGVIDVPSIAGKMDQTLAKATNFYSPYRLGMIGIDQADIDPITAPVITGVSNNLVGRIILTWSGIGGAAGYTVYRSTNTNADGWTNITAPLATVSGSNTTAYTDMSPVSGVFYNYFVTSFDNATPYSNESWFSSASGPAYINTNFFISITNPASGLWYGSNTVVVFSGKFSTNGGILASTNGTVFYSVTETNSSGDWSNTLPVPFGAAITNVFYAVLTNASDAVTNRVTNYYDSTPPYAAVTNYTNNVTVATNGIFLVYTGTNYEDKTTVTATVFYTNGGFFGWTNTSPAFAFTLNAMQFTNGPLALRIVASNSVGNTYTNSWTNTVQLPIAASNMSNDSVYLTVNDAIANASNGHTVVVFAGTFFENVVISGKTNISLIGLPWLTNTDNTASVLDGTGVSFSNNNGIELTNSVGVRIEGITIKNYTNGLFFSANVSNSTVVNNNFLLNGASGGTNGAITMYASTSTVNNISSNYILSNSLWSNRNGITLYSTSNCVFIANRIYWNANKGVETVHWNYKPNRLRFEGNTICSNGSDGFRGQGDGYDCVFVSNTIFSNTGSGYSITSWDRNVFISNTVFSNGGNGIYSSWGFSSNMFINNTFVYNDRGVYIDGNNTARDDRWNYYISNIISWNRSDGVYIRHGDSNFINDNIIASNVSRGVLIETPTNGDACSNTIMNNIIADNTNEGVYLIFNRVMYSSVISNTIRGNLYGVRVHEGDSNIISGNTICSNRYDGVYVVPVSNMSSFNMVDSNIIYGHTNGTYGRGIIISGDLADTNTIRGNVIFGNRTGIHVSDSEQLTIVQNTLTNNSQWGLYSDGVYDGNLGAGLVAYNNFADNLSNMRVNSGWYSTDIRSNYFGSLSVDAISNSIANCADTNFIAPYRLGMVGIWQSNIIPPATPNGLIKATLGTTNYITWNAVSGAAGYNVWRVSGVYEWTNMTAPYATVLAPSYMDTAAGPTYYYYVTAFDDATPLKNESWFSAAETIANTPPLITNLSVSPQNCATNTAVVFSAVYYDFEGNGPSNGVNLVLSNGTSGIATTNTMLYASGTFTNGAVYTNSIVMTAAGSYLSFVYAAGSNSSVTPSVSLSTNVPYVVNVYVASNTNTGIRYGTVQDAVVNASAGETIAVFAGINNERVFVSNKVNINIVGLPWLTNADNTQAIFDGTGIAATLSAGITVTNSTGIRISGLSIRSFTNGIHLWAAATNCVIEANRLYSNGIGMPAGYHGGVLINSNSVYSNAFLSNFVWGNNSGIVNSNTGGNFVYANILASNTLYGIGTPSTSGGDKLSNVLINNTIISNGGNGLNFMAFYHYTTIRSNFIASNAGMGMSLQVFRSNDVCSNVLYMNNSGGAAIITSSGQNYSNTFACNQFLSNKVFGFGLFSQTNTSVSNHFILSNTFAGNPIAIWITNGSNVTIMNNLIYDATNGISIMNTRNNFITRNTITNCTNTGISLSGSGMLDTGLWAGGFVSFNNILNNGTNLSVPDSINVSNFAQSNYYGTMNAGTIALKMDQSLAKSTNWYAPYRFEMIGVDQTDIAPLPSPVITNALTNASTNIVVQWQAVGGAVGYRVYRSADAGTCTNFNTYYTNLGAVTSFTDTNIVIGTRYYYFVTSIDNAAPLANESWFSDPASARFLPSYFAEITNPAPGSSLFPVMNTISGNYGPLTGADIYFSVNGTVFGMPATNNGFWSTNIDLAPYVGTTNVFYAVASNTSLGLAETNAQTNYIAPLAASNTNNGSRYISLSQAVSSASNGHTVVVFAGTVNEQVPVVGKTNLSIIGWPWFTNNDNTKAVMSGAGLSGMTHGFHLTNSLNIIIRGLSIAYYTNGVFLSGDVSNCVIQSNHMYSNGIGYINGYGGGVHILWSSALSNAILENRIVSNASGIVMSNASLTAIRSNFISQNVNQGIIAAINYDGGLIRSNNEFSFNTVCSNGNNGIFFRGTWRSNTLFRNRLFNNAGSGIYIDGFSRSDIAENDIFSNSQSGVHFQSGGAQMDASVFRQNRIYGNTEYGIAILSDTADTNSIISNHIYGSRTNIYVNTADVTTIASNLIYNAAMGIGLNEGQTNLVYRNTVTNCSVYGVYLGGVGMTNATGWVGGEMAYNNIFQNTGSNFRISDTVNISNIARSNYWGVIDVASIAGKMDQTLAKATNFYAPYRLGMIGIDQADIDPATPPVINGVSNNLIGRIIISWTAVGGAAGYNIYRTTATNADAWTNLSPPIATLSGAAATAYTDASAVAGVLYNYYLTSYDSAAPLYNESWFSTASGPAYINSNSTMSITSPAQSQWFVSNTTVTFAGTYSMNGGLLASTNGTVFYDVTATNASGDWSNTVVVPFAGALTNIYFAVFTNQYGSITNAMTNYYDNSAPLALLTNLSTNMVVSNTNCFWGTVTDSESGVSNVTVIISNSFGYITNIAAVITNTTMFYAMWDTLPSTVTNGAYFAYVNAVNNAGLAVNTVPIPFAVTNQKAYEEIEKAFVFNNPYNGTGDIVFKDLTTNVTLSIYTVSGKLVRKLTMAEGDKSGILTWDVADANGRLASPGVYVCYVNSPAGVRIMKLIIKRRKQ